ncbi:MAG: DUF3108 domain-containing protein [Bacteroidaceae bacterium]|nr:DUF3108 domain-containing protein [Bacteroidaceae bacterium]
MILLLLFNALTISAQCPAENNAFQDGEQLDYEMYFNWKFVWVKAGTSRLKTDGITLPNGTKGYQTSLIATSSRRADNFFKMRDTLISRMTTQMEPLYFRKGAEEGKRYTVDEAWFSYPNGKSHAKQHRLFRDGSVKTTQDTMDECIYDMLSILQRARSFDPKDYKVGDKIHFQMATGRKVENQTLIFRGKKNIKAEDGDETTYRCLVLSLVEYDKKGREQEVITFYVTDDLNHLPVRLDLYLNFGSAKAFIKDIKGNRHPLTSVVKK